MIHVLTGRSIRQNKDVNNFKCIVQILTVIVHAHVYGTQLSYSAFEINVIYALKGKCFVKEIHIYSS